MSEDLPPPVRRFLGHPDRHPGRHGDDELLLRVGRAGEPEADGAASPGERARVAVLAPDLVALRAAAVPAGLLAPAVGVFMAEPGPALSLVPRPEWPVLRLLRSVPRAGGRWLLLRFGGAVDVAEVVREVGRQAVWPGRVVVGTVPDEPMDDLGGVVDDRVLNPAGFRRHAARPVMRLSELPADVTAGAVGDLRDVLAVRVDGADDVARRAVVRLACAGVPLVPDDVASLPVGLDPSVAAAVAAPVDLDDPVAREEHSIVVRRAALDGHGAAVRRTLADPPAVSVVLATRREDMLDHALAQVRRQQGVGAVELVLAPHGFDVDLGRVRAGVGDGVAVQVVPAPSDAVFGDVLDAAVRVAGGDLVLKMDDDDWYAPSFIADLLRARAYSGAEVVGMPAEMHYVAERDLTVFRGHETEQETGFVAGGTILLDRSLLGEVGGFRPVRKFVDAQLLDVVRAAGGAIYRTHGLGYVLRRNPGGHTWEADLAYLLDPARVESQRAGLTPSRLMG